MYYTTTYLFNFCCGHTLGVITSFFKNDGSTATSTLEAKTKLLKRIT